MGSAVKEFKELKWRLGWMVGRRVRRNDAGKIRSRQILQGLVSYFKESDIYSKDTEEPEQDLK